MTRMMSINLKANEIGVTALALAPGWMRTEAVYKHYGLKNGDPEFMKIADFKQRNRSNTLVELLSRLPLIHRCMQKQVFFSRQARLPQSMALRH
ncbi:hypothetical protein [Paenibacillus sp. SI8]|uniref:hypothetical protein n=1 Tax=unclassified Paenibacillus TaxID=185978 RepID=UPI0034676D2F